MALQVWLPLNGDLRNNGIGNVIVTNNGATVDSAGKIGSCYYFNGSSHIRISLPTDMTTILGCTVAAWVKSESSTLALGGISQDVSNYSLPCVTLYSSGWQFTSTARGGYGYVNGGTVANTNVWHHVACTIDTSGNIQTYLDGAKVASSSLTTLNVAANTILTSNNFIEIGCDHPGGDEFLTGRVNDFRVYDHCLSAAEVKEISKGLICHYQMNCLYNGYGNPNLCKNSRTFGAGWGGSGITTQNAFNGFAVKSQASATSQKDTVYYSNVLTANPNEIYTVSFWAKADTAHSISCFLYNNASGIIQCSKSIASTGASGTSSDGHTAIALTTEWKYYWITWTFNNGTAATKNLLLGRNAANASGISIAKVKLERGAYATPWAPHPDDTEKVLSTIFDDSGYGNNGTCEGTITLTAPSPRYSFCMNFNGSNARIHTPNLTPAVLTVSFWMKRNANTGTRQFMYTAWSGITCELQTNGTPTFAVNRASYPTITGTAITTDSGWVHYCATFDTINGSKLYQNGILKSSNNNVTPIAYSISTNYIGGYYSTYYNGLMSDFRIYATALSAADVKELYETSMIVESDGTIKPRVLTS